MAKNIDLQVEFDQLNDELEHQRFVEEWCDHRDPTVNAIDDPLCLHPVGNYANLIGLSEMIKNDPLSMVGTIRDYHQDTMDHKPHQVTATLDQRPVYLYRFYSVSIFFSISFLVQLQVCVLMVVQV